MEGLFNAPGIEELFDFLDSKRGEDEDIYFEATGDDPDVVGMIKYYDKEGKLVKTEIYRRNSDVEVIEGS